VPSGMSRCVPEDASQQGQQPLISRPSMLERVGMHGVCVHMSSTVADEIMHE
jgi:hypothetical protein